jgi:hypothetical protein
MRLPKPALERVLMPHWAIVFIVMLGVALSMVLTWH